jgi:hypothetical protein
MELRNKWASCVQGLQVDINSPVNVLANSALGIYSASDGKVFDIDVNLIHLLELTDNEPHETRLPFPAMFIANSFCYKGIVMHGVGLVEYPDCFEGMNKYYLRNNPHPNRKLTPEALLPIDATGKIISHYIKAFTIVEIDNLQIMASVDLCRFPIPAPKNQLWFTTDSQTLPENISSFGEKCKTNLCLFALNLCDFIHDPEVTFVDRKFTKWERRQFPKNNTIPQVKHVVIRGKLKRYMYALRKGEAFRYSYKFWVRGHFRHFRSDRFKLKQGLTTWVFPYVKGQGILVEKQYQLREGKS